MIPSNENQIRANTQPQDLTGFTPNTDSAAYELRMLDAARLRVLRHAGVTRLTLEGDRSWLRVSLACAFPLSDPDHYIGFLDANGKDIGMLYDPGLLDAQSRQIVAEELERRYFLPVIERVLSVQEEFGTVTWRVQTDRGEREIVARNLKDNLHELSATRILITDVEGNRFEFPDLNRLDSRTLGILMRNL